MPAPNSYPYDNIGETGTGVQEYGGSTPAALEERRMPFVHSILSYKPWEEITVGYPLDINEDIYLMNHLLINAYGEKHPSECLPVLPMAFGTEIMAETAACLTPGHGLIGFEGVSASRWISLKGAESIPLQVSARVIEYCAASAHFRVRVEIRIDGQKAAAMSGTVLLGKHYLLEIRMEFDELANPRKIPLTGEQLYSEGYLFHGPMLQPLLDEMTYDHQSIGGHLRVLPVDSLFRSNSTPELLTHPIILDGVAQALAVLGMTMEMHIFPIGFRKLEVYRSAPAVGLRLPFRLQITELGPRICCADVEIQDGEGTVWMRMRGWQGWIFRWTKQLLNFLRLPTSFTCCTSLQMPNLPQGAACLSISKRIWQDYNTQWIGRWYLHSEELEEFDRLSQFPPKQLQWLLGRVAAKDAVRVWLARRKDGAMLHPAALKIRNNEAGKPFVAEVTGHPVIPQISISHSGDHAVAVAHEEPMGIDIEKVEQRGRPFLESFLTSEERNLLESFVSTDAYDAVVTSLWCAKEAVAKCLGTAIRSAPQLLEVVEISLDGRIAVRLRGDGRTYLVSTVLTQQHIVATVSGTGQ